MVAAIDIDRLLHVKIPVTNVERSARWYAQLLDIRLAMEFVEDDQIRGVVLTELVTGSGLPCETAPSAAATRSWPGSTSSRSR